MHSDGRAPEIEFRTTPCAIEARNSGGSKRQIGGYAAVFETRSQPLGGFRETVERSFFNKSCADKWPGVIARFNHRDEFLLGATRSGTLQLNIDETGLDYTVDLPECRSDVHELVLRGDIGNSSFAFQVYEDDWDFDGGTPMRHLISGRLIDVAPVTTPAYTTTTVGLRSLACHIDVPIEDVVTLAARDELRKLFVRTDNGGQRPVRTRTGREAMTELMAAKWPRGTLTGPQARAELTRLARSPWNV